MQHTLEIPAKAFTVLARWARDNNSTPAAALRNFLDAHHRELRLINRPAHLRKAN